MPLILVVDDDYTIRDLVQTLLESEGYQTVGAADGREALSRLADLRPSLVLSDLMMPFVSGKALYQAMQADASYRTIPFVLMTAVPQDSSDAAPRYAAIVPKPFDLDALLATIARVLQESPA